MTSVILDFIGTTLAALSPEIAAGTTAATTAAVPTAATAATTAAIPAAATAGGESAIMGTLFGSAAPAAEAAGATGGIGSTLAGIAAPALAGTALQQGIQGISTAQQNQQNQQLSEQNAQDMEAQKRAATGLSSGMFEQKLAHGGQVNLEDGQFIIPADVVSALGNGSTKAGAAFLDEFFGNG